jgi:predicted naringenin-chalcone synthase
MAAPATVYLSRVRSSATRYKSDQKAGIEWLAAAHAMSDHSKNNSLNLDELRSRYLKMMERFGCSPDKIASRGHMISDFSSFHFSELEIYNVIENPSGASVEKRGEVFQREAGSYMRELFKDELHAPTDIIHVSCTGYVSPSVAQSIVVEKGWGEVCEVTHAYHMGCYAAIPSLRMASGYAQSKDRVEVVHTELCTLHLNPADHTPEQMVVQSLFADGLIAYSVSLQNPSCRGEKGFEIVSLREELIANSQDAMSWVVSPSGFRMSLSRKVPEMIAGSLGGFLQRLFATAGLNYNDSKEGCVFAIHPGGPKIIESLEKSLELRPDQVKASKEILFRHGNMSSATLPHIWEYVLGNEAVTTGTLVIGLAFGPGLTCAGCVLRKV